MTSILGISAFYHDSAATMVVDGKIIAAAQEERFSRIKHDPNYPYNAVNYVLNEANIKLNQVDYIVFFEKPFLKFERLLETYLAFAPKGFKSFCMSMPLWLREKLFQKNFLYNKLKQHDENFKDINKIHLLRLEPNKEVRFKVTRPSAYGERYKLFVIKKNIFDAEYNLEDYGINLVNKENRIIVDTLKWNGKAKKSGFENGDYISEFKIENLDRPNKRVIYPIAILLLIIFGYLNSRRKE